ncbi:MAG TPA: hypothetical protein VKQ73_17365 [Stellaceae bacterium]|nr:hypothetical protein [Stellaceae bacterium]
MNAPRDDIAAELIAAVRDNATLLFEEQRDRAAGEIAAFGEVLRGSARSLSEDGAVAQYTIEAARRIDAFAGELRARSWGELVGDIEDFAKSSPLGFLAAAIGAGLVAGRLLALSAPRPDETAPPQPASRHDKPLAAAARDNEAAIAEIYPGRSAAPRETL